MLLDIFSDAHLYPSQSQYKAWWINKVSVLYYSHPWDLKPACLPACLSSPSSPVCPPALLPPCPSVSLPSCRPSCLSACLTSCLPSVLPVCLPSCLSVSLPVCLTPFLSVSPSYDSPVVPWLWGPWMPMSGWITPWNTWHPLFVCRANVGTRSSLPVPVTRAGAGWRREMAQADDRVLWGIRAGLGGFLFKTHLLKCRFNYAWMLGRSWKTKANPTHLVWFSS